MEKYQEARLKALRYLRVADHMLTVTYPLVKDSKLLLTVTENLFLAITNSISAILHHEQYYKNLAPFKDDFNTKYSLFRSRCIEKFGFEKSYLQFILDIKRVIIERQKSPIEFRRKDSFVICSETYQIQKLTQEIIQTYLDKTRNFVYKMNNILSEKHGRLH